MAQQAPLSISHLNNIQLAAEEEAKGNTEGAIRYYEEAIKDERADEMPYNRLMILYRKEKKYNDELRVINKGIKVFTQFYKKSIAKTAKGKKLSDLSEAFMMSAGLKDRKGTLVYQPEPIGRWMKRKEIASRKIQDPRSKIQEPRTKNQIRSKTQGAKTQGGKTQTKTKRQTTRSRKNSKTKK